MSSQNGLIRLKIEDLERQRESAADTSETYLRLTREIEVLARQLEPEHRWSASPGFWVAVVAALSAFIAAIPFVQAVLAAKHSAQVQKSGSSAAAAQTKSEPASPPPTSSK